MIHPLNPKDIIARRCARELRAGEVVNLGLGTPTLVANHLPSDAGVIFHTENGAFGFGGRPTYYQADSDLTNAGCEPITLNPGAALMDLATSLGAMRRGYIDVTILGALEADAQGNIANWATRRQGRWWPGIGGAMDLCHGTPKVIVTELAVFDVRPGAGLLLRELRADLDLARLRNCTEAAFAVSPRLQAMDLGELAARTHQPA